MKVSETIKNLVSFIINITIIVVVIVIIISIIIVCFCLGSNKMHQGGNYQDLNWEAVVFRSFTYNN